jgi:hypothetical protein
MANPEHLEILRQGVKAWNAWRAEDPSVLPDLMGANLMGRSLPEANLAGAILQEAKLLKAHLRGADLRDANLYKADLSRTDLSGANLSGAFLNGAQLVETNLEDATLTNCHIYGVAAWGLRLNEGTRQGDLIITRGGQPAVTVDNLKVAQFVSLLLENKNIRDVIDTVGRRAVLLLGRFTENRIEVLERLRDALRERGYVPIVFNFDKPETKNFTETVRLLAGLSHFVIADVTNPKSTPLELEALVPQIMVPFQPIIEEGEKPFAMLQDLWQQHRDRVLEPIYYPSIDVLVASFHKEIIEPAEALFDKLVVRKAETMGERHLRSPAQITEAQRLAREWKPTK